MVFEFPQIYSFPPFFTAQPNLQTYQTQVEHWRRLVLAYCQYHKVWGLSLNGFAANEGEEDDESEPEHDAQASVFENKDIHRALKKDFIQQIYTAMIENGEAAWISPKNHKLGVLVLWHSLEEWGNVIMDWISNTGQEGSVLTLYEVQEGELSQSEEFHGMSQQMLLRVMDVLAAQGKVRVLKEEGTIAGVKFGN